MAGEREVGAAPAVRHPAVTIAPPGWITTASPCPAPTGVETSPLSPNVVSSPDAGGGVTQRTAIAVTFPFPALPLPLFTVHT